MVVVVVVVVVVVMVVVVRILTVVCGMGRVVRGPECVVWGQRTGVTPMPSARCDARTSIKCCPACGEGTSVRAEREPSGAMVNKRDDVAERRAVHGGPHGQATSLTRRCPR